MRFDGLHSHLTILFQPVLAHRSRQTFQRLLGNPYPVRLTQMLAGVPGLTLPSPLPGATHVYWKYPLIVDPKVIKGGTDALGAALKAAGVFCAPRYIRKPAFQCQVLAEQKTYGKSRCPYTCPSRNGAGEVVYNPAEYPGTMTGLERVLVLPWNEFYTDEHVAFIATAVRDAVATL